MCIRVSLPGEAAVVFSFRAKHFPAASLQEDDDTLRECAEHNGELHDLEVYSMLRREWPH